MLDEIGGEERTIQEGLLYVFMCPCSRTPVKDKETCPPTIVRLQPAQSGDLNIEVLP